MKTITESKFIALFCKDRLWEETPNYLFVLQSKYPFTKAKIHFSSKYIEDELQHKLNDNHLKIIERVLA